MAKRKPARVEAPAERAPGSAYAVLARRYRPQQFGDLVGQEPVARALVNALQTDRVAHAYLFTGTRGVGKTSAARILAKALNCEKGPTATPCDQCDMCRSIAVGEDVDVLEIDGASNRGIDEVREIRQNVQYRPGRGRYKIYIIDEVHMLTPAAFNALLKTLEEPPSHVKFIFATTEAHKIPVTILSRCQRFDFAGIGTPQIVDRLRQIVAAEGMQADDDALELVARRAGGSMRDSQSLLDQLLAFGEGRLTAEQVHRVLGTARDDRVSALVQAVLMRDAVGALQELAAMADQGLQLGELIDQLIDYWRDLMIVQAAGPQAAALVNPSRREALLQQKQAPGLDTILAGLDVLVTTKSRLRTSGHERIVLEMGLIRLCRLDELLSVGQLAELLRQGPTGPEPRPSSPAGGPSRPALPTTRLTDLAAESAKKKADSTEPAAAQPLTPQTLPQVWEKCLKALGPMLSADLGRGSPAISAPNTLVIRFPGRYNLIREQCQAPDRLAHIEGVLAKITGQGWKIRVEGAEGEQAASGRGDQGAGSRPRVRRPRSEAAQLLFRRAEEVLGAQVVREEEGFGADPASAGPELVPDEEE